MPENTLYYGDNLDVLRRYVADESVDLVYLDPPFNSNATYNVLFAEQDGARAAAQIKAFGDTWRWDQAAAAAFQEVVEAGGDVSRAMQAFRTFLGENNLLAYLAMMAPRLVELRRVLRPTGSIYLHCDPTASHYLKMLMDAVFGAANYRTEIIWHRGRGFKRSSAKRFPHKHDTILFYCRDPETAIFHPQHRPHKPEYIRRFKKDAAGRLYRDDVNPTGGGRRVIYLDEVKGDIVDSVWRDIPPLNPVARERLGYPTQKPEALLERIVRASSNEGDVVLDPFCGCGTTISVAQRLGRRWIGIDITHLAVNLIRVRLRDAFGDEADFEVIGEPTTAADAQELADHDPYQFQWWALGLVGARPAEGKKGADQGIDGRLYFHDEGAKGKTKEIVFSVKAGKVSVAHVRDLRGVLDREGAEIGALLSMHAPTAAMRKEAASAGFYDSPWGTRHPALQLLTVEDLLAGKQVDMPPTRDQRTFRRAPRAKRERQERRLIEDDEG